MVALPVCSPQITNALPLSHLDIFFRPHVKSSRPIRLSPLPVLVSPSHKRPIRKSHDPSAFKIFRLLPSPQSTSSPSHQVTRSSIQFYDSKDGTGARFTNKNNNNREAFERVFHCTPLQTPPLCRCRHVVKQHHVFSMVFFGRDPLNC